MMTDFAGKVVLITGAAGGIGQALCRLFAGRGGRIAALDRAPTVLEFGRQLTGEGFDAAAVVADIADLSQVGQAVAQIHDDLGNIDILINNAGFSKAPNLETATPETWNEDIAGNLGGAFHCTRLAIEDMKAAGAGAIVNIGSVNGLSALGDPAYSAAKAGLISYTKSVALEYGRFGIRANVICPGTVRTPILDKKAERNPDVEAQLVKWYPLGRVAEPIEIAKAAAFLASDDASAITGTMLAVDCGLTAGNILMARELTAAEF